MNETAKVRDSVLTGHRVGGEKGAAKRRIDYETSELRAIEILEEVCPKLEDYEWKRQEDGVRVFSKDKDLPKARTYSSKERDRLDRMKDRLKNFCFEMTSEYFDEIVAMIRGASRLDILQDRACNHQLRLCHGPAFDQSVAKDVAAFQKWKKKDAAKKEKERKRREKAEMKEKEQKEKEEKEQKEKEEKEQNEQKEKEEAKQTDTGDAEHAREEREGDGGTAGIAGHPASSSGGDL